MTTTAYISHPECELHDAGEERPEAPGRIAVIRNALKQQQLWDQLNHHEAPEATQEALLRVHPEIYVEQVKTLCPTEAGQLTKIGLDVEANEHSWQAAIRAAGAVTYAVDLLMQGKADHAFCAARPPGHHAEKSRAMGFCFFGNIAIGAKHALDAYGLERVAIIDFDAHHGNGTEDLLQDDPRVLFISSFQHPFYPFTVPDSSRDNMIHSPIPAGAGSEAFRQAMEEQWIPALREFQPQMVFISAGFDAHQDDPLANLNLHETDYRWITQELKASADQFADGKIISVLEGGYNLDSLAKSAAEHVRVLLNS